MPTYNPLGGPLGRGHVTFDRAKSQYLDAGPRTLNIATNLGLTIVAVVRFTGTAGYGESIVDMNSGAGDESINIARSATSSTLRFSIQNSRLVVAQVDCDNIIVPQSSWLSVVARYKPITLYVDDIVPREISTGSVELWVNNKMCRSSTSGTSFVYAAVIDRVASHAYNGRSSSSESSYWSMEQYLNGDLAGLLAVDEYLSTDATSAIADAMVRGVDLTETSGWTNFPASGYNNAAARTLTGGPLL